MGTRNITKVIKDGEVKVSQYGQWDGYPEYSGNYVIDFLGEPGNIEALAEGVDKSFEATADQLEAAMNVVEANADPTSFEYGKVLETLYPSLSRNTGVAILETIANSDGVILNNDYDFENDEVWCEGLYTVNLDTREFTTRYGGTTVTYGFDELPDRLTYLRQFSDDE